MWSIKNSLAHGIFGGLRWEKSYHRYNIFLSYTFSRVLLVTVSIRDGMKLIEWVWNLNLFTSAQTRDLDHVRCAEIRSTRLYLLLGTLVSVVLIIFISFEQQLKTAQITSPTFGTFQRLQDQGYVLTCPCSKITTQLSTFVAIEPAFHQVRTEGWCLLIEFKICHVQICSSSFVSSTWIHAVFESALSPQQSVLRVVLSAHFQLLRSFCKLSQTIIADAVSGIYSSSFVTITLLLENALMDQTQPLLDYTQSREASLFERDLTTIRDITLSNQLLSAFETGWDVILDPDVPIFYSMVPRVYSKVFCLLPMIYTPMISYIEWTHAHPSFTK